MEILTRPPASYRANALMRNYESANWGLILITAFCITDAGLIHLQGGVPRTAYRGIVSIRYRDQRVHLVPPEEWTGYTV